MKASHRSIVATNITICHSTQQHHVSIHANQPNRATRRAEKRDESCCLADASYLAGVDDHSTALAIHNTRYVARKVEMNARLHATGPRKQVSQGSAEFAVTRRMHARTSSTNDQLNNRIGCHSSSWVGCDMDIHGGLMEMWHPNSSISPFKTLT